MMTRNSDIIFMTEYLKNVLFFATVRQGKIIKSNSDVHYFCIDNELVYENFYSDFGPLNLGCVYRYCKLLNQKIKQLLNKQSIVHYTSIDAKKKTNAAFLLGCYGVLYLSLSPKDAIKPLLIHGQTYRSFQDATHGDSLFTISLLDCLHAIKKAKDLGFFNFQDFSFEEYDSFAKIRGDLNWIVPGKFLAFIGPIDYKMSVGHPPEMYIGYFKENNVTIVIRLNKRMYDANVFNSAGIMHYDLFFPDGSTPPRHILLKFLQISEEADGALAVHCKAGLGRTGSLIGCYLMKHYRMTAHEAIGWMRICRPGSVIGHQQAWLEQCEALLIKQGNIYRKRTFQDTEKFPVHEFGVYSIAEKARKQRPLIMTKSPSPPPPLQKQTRSDTTPSVGPQSSKIREAPSKAAESEQSYWRMKSPKLSSHQKNPPKGDTHNPSSGISVSRRGSGAGEPRESCTMPRSASRSNTVKSPTQRAKEKHFQNNQRNSAVYPPLPTFRTTQGPLIKTINDAKDLLVRSSMAKDNSKKFNTSISVTPHYNMHTANYAAEYYTTPAFTNTARVIPSSLNTVPRAPTQLQPPQRRRLGRSPSPSPCSSPMRFVEPSRATNTSSPMDRFMAEGSSKSTLREALSRLRLCAAREVSAGAGSLAARGATPRRAPAAGGRGSARSDERPLATQGDMLNSIKFLRRFRETLNADKISAMYQDNLKLNASAKDKPNIKDVSSRTSMKTRIGFYKDFNSFTSNPRERSPMNATRNTVRPPRTPSPKQRSPSNQYRLY